MTKSANYFRQGVLMLIILMFQPVLFAQDDTSLTIYKNQVSTNLLLPFLGSVDLTYERSVGKKLAFGIAGAVYGKGIEEITVDDSFDDLNVRTNYEIMPLARLYFSGNQKKSHFVELFGSISNVDESDSVLRFVNAEGFGVYEISTENYMRGGLGGGYGYRFLFLDGRLAAEAQFGIRTNFNIDFFVLNAALVRTGIKVGYRF